ncbi:MAG: hypothetical protein Alis3KO_02320 [Aliiglaciecola sp.]
MLTGAVLKKGFLLLSLIGMISVNSHSHYQDVSPIDRIEHVINEAEDHLRVLPEKTISLLENNSPLLAIATPEQASAWHLTAMLSAIQVSDLDLLNQSLYALSELKETEYFNQHLAKILRGLGVWMRRSGHLTAAKAGYLCSIDYSDSPKDKVIAMINLGVVERNLGNLVYSNNMYTAAKELAAELEEYEFLAIIENNLGTLAITEQRYKDAQQHFAKALEMNQYLNRRSGEVLTANNLLLSFLYQNETLLFQRLQSRVKRLLIPGKDSAREAYFKILQAVHQVQVAPSTLENAHQIIAGNLPLVNDKGIHGLLQPLLAGIEYQISLPTNAQNQRYNGVLVQQFSMCDWQKYSQDNYLAVLKSKDKDTSTN